MSYVNEALDELYADYFDSAYVEDGIFIILQKKIGMMNI